MIPLSYKIKFCPRSVNYVPKTWLIEGSKDKINWHTLDKQVNQSSLNSNQVVDFQINNDNTPIDDYKYIRIVQNAPNIQKSNFLAIKSFEIYGYKL